MYRGTCGLGVAPLAQDSRTFAYVSNQASHQVWIRHQPTDKIDGILHILRLGFHRRFP